MLLLLVSGAMPLYVWVWWMLSGRLEPFSRLGGLFGRCLLLLKWCVPGVDLQGLENQHADKDGWWGWGTYPSPAV